eukprot:TRINITY_DN12864_c0_g1_i4.p1 TRINITY_DN12864_c0_g1~~TRINITY_DN12864_c0_g1_i4.p1  ORF type:complete len:199 (-),score=36.76 TRINITY_DN12864_c0_g1_i4:185-781(-)
MGSRSNGGEGEGGGGFCKVLVSPPYLFFLAFSSLLMVKHTFQWEMFSKYFNLDQSKMLISILPPILFFLAALVGLIVDYFEKKGRNIVIVLSILFSVSSSIGFLVELPNQGLTVFCTFCLVLSTSMTLGTVLSMALSFDTLYFGFLFTLVGAISGLLYLPLTYLIVIHEKEFWLHVAFLACSSILIVYPVYGLLRATR